MVDYYSSVLWGKNIVVFDMSDVIKEKDLLKLNKECANEGFTFSYSHTGGQSFDFAKDALILIFTSEIFKAILENCSYDLLKKSVLYLFAKYKKKNKKHMEERAFRVWEEKGNDYVSTGIELINPTEKEVEIALDKYFAVFKNS